MNKIIIIENLINYELFVGDKFLHVNLYKQSTDDPNVKIRYIINNDNNDNYKENKSYYYILDCGGSFALGHWIYETFICISLLIELNKKYNNIKILTTNNKKYVKSILNLFNITNEIVYNIDNYNNTTFSPLILSLNFDKIEPKLYEYLNYHLNFYINYIKNNIINLNSNNKLLFLPRNTIDNYPHNDRTIVNTDKIKELVINNGGIVLDTYNFNNIKYQFSIINDTNTIILDIGSSFLFNCIFLKNKNIYLIDNFEHFETQYNDTLPYVKYIIQKILDNNNVKIINSYQLDWIECIFKELV